MRKMILTVEVELDEENDGMDAAAVKRAFYDAGEDLPFGFEITEVKDGGRG